MSNPATVANQSFAVRLTNIEKRYTLSSPSDKLIRLPWTRHRAAPEYFYALKGVSLEIPKGRSFGILGVNGAGKSTLLGIIAANIAPTGGQVEVNGRTQLLQLGGSFTPELTGRQNVVAHARARGVPTSEIAGRIAYVEEFADVGLFFDQPLETYSSGMRARLAFANAFAVTPDILIVDEALAVGDARFANKCFRKIDEIKRDGTTILFTSHSSDSVLRLCDRGIVLNKGELVAHGTAKEAVEAYSKILQGDGSSSKAAGNVNLQARNGASVGAVETRSGDSTSSAAPSHVGTDDLARIEDSVLYNKEESVVGSGGARIVDCSVLVNGEKPKSRTAIRGDYLDILVRVEFDDAVSEANFGFTMTDIHGVIFYGVNQLWAKQPTPEANSGDSRLYHFGFPLNIGSGDWFVSLAIADRIELLQQRRSVLHFEMTDPGYIHTGSGWIDLELGTVSDSSADNAH